MTDDFPPKLRDYLIELANRADDSPADEDSLLHRIIEELVAWRAELLAR